MDDLAHSRKHSAPERCLSTLAQGSLPNTGPDERNGNRRAASVDEQGIDYEIVRGPLRPGKRADLRRLSGQQLYPVVEFENGSIYREESRDMAATIRAGSSTRSGLRPLEGHRDVQPSRVPALTS